jgi:hypothetical protein
MADPFDCPGPECHAGDFAGFDHFCDVLDVRDGEYGHAFAAWLGGATGWDGNYQRLDALTPEERP